jgi:hypothetical protein
LRACRGSTPAEREPPCASPRTQSEAISDLPVTVGEKQKQRSSSRFIGVCWKLRSAPGPFACTAASAPPHQPKPEPPRIACNVAQGSAVCACGCSCRAFSCVSWAAQCRVVRMWMRVCRGFGCGACSHAFAVMRARWLSLCGRAPTACAQVTVTTSPLPPLCRPVPAAHGGAPAPPCAHTCTNGSDQSVPRVDVLLRRRSSFVEIR